MGVLHELVRELRNMDQAVLVDAHIHESPEIRHIRHDPLKHHASLKVGNLVDPLLKRRCPELRTRIASRLFEFGQNVSNGRFPKPLVNEIRR